MQIYAHRGASQEFPEHTLAAYQAAVDQGADGFECDLRLTKDEVAILWHDSTMLERAGNPGLIAEMTFAQVQRAYPAVLTLDTFLDFAVQSKKGVLLETKHPVISGNRIEEVLVDSLIASKALTKIDISVMSFSWLAIEKIKRINPKIHTTLLLNKYTPWFQAKHSSSRALGPGIHELRNNPDLAAKTSELGRDLFVWTVDYESDIKLCKSLNVDILITNKPAHAREVLRYP